MEQEQYEDFSIGIIPKKVNSHEVKPEPPVEVDNKNSNLYTVLDRGDNIIQKAHRKAIILVGLTRRGKSTTFNWMLKKPMKGYTSREGQQPYYINTVDNENDVAVVGNSYTSVTLAPNVHVDFQKGVSLIDMAGYEDKRNYVGVIGVSYFLKQVFEKVKQAKFIVVITEGMFEEASGESLIKTFQGFLNMFHYKEMSKEIRAKLRQSIVVVITRSTKQYQYYAKLKAIIEKIKDQHFRLQNKGALLQILSWILLKITRLQPFKAAVSNRPPQPCEFVQTLSKNQKDPWEFFDLQQAQKIMSKSPIAFPFKKDFSVLDQSQVRKFTNIIQSRVKAFEGFAAICISFVKVFFKNWQEFIAQRVQKSKLKNLNFYQQMDEAFINVAEYVKLTDFYQQNSQKDFVLRPINVQVSFIQSLRQIQKIFDQVEKVTSISQGLFMEHMQAFNREFPVFIECFRTFAKSTQDHRLLHRLEYILKRGFKEFSRLYQLKQDCITDANQKLRDYLTGTDYLSNPVIRKQLEGKVIKNMTVDLMNRMFTTIPKLEEYEAFFLEYESKYSDMEDQVFLKNHLYQIDNIKANLHLKAENKIESLCCYIRMYNVVDEVSSIVLNSHNFQQNQKNDELNQYSMKKIKAVRRMVEILKCLPEGYDFYPIDEALQLCQHHKMIEDVNELYELIINSPLTPHDKLLQRYNDYAVYLATWGDVDGAIRLLKKRMKLQEQNFNSYSQSIQMMKMLSTDRDKYLKQFRNNLNTITRLPIQDETIKYMFVQLEFKLKS